MPVDIYRVPLDLSALTHRELRRLLSADEIARADRFRDSRHTLKFVACRGSLRLILAERLGQSPQEIRFDYGSKGKPRLPNGGIEFNVSHSGDLAIVATCANGEVGVDVERYRDHLEDRKLAQRFFSQAELEDLDSLSGSRWREGFYTCWTRKEAYMKAVGDGFSIPLSSFRVSVLPDASPKLLEVESNPAECGRWAIQDVAVPKGYRASVVTRPPKRLLRLFDLTWN